MKIKITEIDKFLKNMPSWALDEDKKKMLIDNGIEATISKRKLLQVAGIEPNYYRCVCVTNDEYLSEAASMRFKAFLKKIKYTERT